jgi:hypothetical protein
MSHPARRKEFFSIQPIGAAELLFKSIGYDIKDDKIL